MKAIILAAGTSSRTKKNKLTMVVNDKELIKYAVDSIKNFVDKVIIVTGFYTDEISNIFKEEEKVSVIYNEQFKLGEITSLKKGILEADDDVLILPGDFPLVHKKTFEIIASDNNEVIVPRYFNEIGYPIKLSIKESKLFLKEGITSDLISFIKKRTPIYYDLLDKGTVFDLNTIEDIRRFEEIITKN
ncbi:hypothetical protein CI105_02640 [Candidatus Izimaplasma bacterium ZiA1]|uniref:nucleotidyltransferase family protein n=1 Tax=Candidatus Izimoplasma sp. ZiA1 TaxID=2024899 RepID=UPI000BAA474F|nr:hypothetical protein CI105_02640 [Candidatus Izimaplasma bacterium ZiA1]